MGGYSRMNVYCSLAKTYPPNFDREIKGPMYVHRLLIIINICCIILFILWDGFQQRARQLDSGSVGQAYKPQPSKLWAGRSLKHSKNVM